MTTRPLAFGVRMSGRGRTLRVRSDAKRTVLEVERKGRRPERREHANLLDALRDCARSWRNGLH